MSGDLLAAGPGDRPRRPPGGAPGSAGKPGCEVAPGAPPPRSVLLVCHANTARSVMAHALLDRMLSARHGGDRIRVRSGGIAPYARDGMLPSLDARIVLREEGIHLGEDDFASTDLRRHRHLIAQADLVLTMTVAQRDALRAYDEAAGRPVYTLREFSGEEGDIGDPATLGESAFRACRDEIKRCLAGSLDRLLAELG